MKTVAPLLAAGSTFATLTILGLLAGIWSGHVLLLFFAGLVLGAYAAWRMVARTILP